jgi:hypothetical protein
MARLLIGLRLCAASRLTAQSRVLQVLAAYDSIATPTIRPAFDPGGTPLALRHGTDTWLLTLPPACTPSSTASASSG